MKVIEHWNVSFKQETAIYYRLMWIHIYRYFHSTFYFCILPSIFFFANDLFHTTYKTSRFQIPRFMKHLPWRKGLGKEKSWWLDFTTSKFTCCSRGAESGFATIIPRDEMNFGKCLHCSRRSPRTTAECNVIKLGRLRSGRASVSSGD